MSLDFLLPLYLRFRPNRNTATGRVSSVSCGSRLRRPPDHFLHGAAAHNAWTLGARLPFSRLTKGSAPALLIVPFIIDDGSLITFTWRSPPLIRRIVTEVLSKRTALPRPPPAPNYPCIF